MSNWSGNSVLSSSGSGPSQCSYGKAVHSQSYEQLCWRRLYLAKSKLSNVAEMAGFMAGFAVVATVELQINEEDLSTPLMVAFVITTSLLVATSMLAVMIATCILPHIEMVAKTKGFSPVNLSPHDQMVHLIDIAWVLANTASLFLFTLDVILMCWIKFTFFSRTASIAATAIMGPVLVIILLFGIIFYRKAMKHQYIISNLKCEELERIQKDIERQTSVILNISRSATNNTLRSNQSYSSNPGGSGSGYDSTASIRSRGSSGSEGSYSKEARRRGSIFIV